MRESRVCRGREIHATNRYSSHRCICQPSNAPTSLSIVGRPATTLMNCQRNQTLNMESGFRSCHGKSGIKSKTRKSRSTNEETFLLILAIYSTPLGEGFHRKLQKIQTWSEARQQTCAHNLGCAGYCMHLRNFAYKYVVRLFSQKAFHITD